MKNAIVASLVIAMLSGFTAGAQQERLRFESLPGDLAKTSWGANIVQDSRGYLWVGSFGSGLYKYDGYVATRFQYAPFDPQSVSNNIYAAWMDKKDIIWLGTPEGLCKFDPRTEKATRYNSSLVSNMPNFGNVGAINEDDQGNLWIGNLEGRIWRYNLKNSKFLPLTSKLNDMANAGMDSVYHNTTYFIHKDRSGAIWIGNNGGLHRAVVDPGGDIRFVHYRHDPTDPSSISNNDVTHMIEDSRGIFWITTAYGLNSFDPRTKKFQSFFADSARPFQISSNTPTCLVEDKKGNLWIGTTSGLNRLDSTRTHFNAWFEGTGDEMGLKSSEIFSVALDVGGNLFIGTGKGMQSLALDPKEFGLLQNNSARTSDIFLAGEVLTQDTREDGNFIGNNRVRSVTGDKDGNIWISTWGAGLDRWNKKTGKITHFRHDPRNPNSLGNDWLSAIMFDPTGDLWVTNGKYLSRMNTTNGTFKNFNADSRNLIELEGRIVQSLCRDKDGMIWVGTGNGIKSFDPITEKFTHYYYDSGNPTGISDYTAISIFADSHDNIWVGTGSIAFNKFDKKTGRFTHYKNNPLDSTSVSSNVVYSIFEDSNHRLWIGTWSGGLCQYDYDNDRFIPHTSRAELPWSSVLSIQEDKAGNLWLGTDRGLACYLVSKKKFITYDMKDGVQGNLFGSGNRELGSSYRDKDGILYFGGNNGLTYFDPAAIHANRNIPPVVITNFKLFDRLQPGKNDAQEIVLDYRQNVFSFEFAALNYTNSSKNQYVYRLEGFDPDWVHASNRRYAGYTNLDPGDYTFRVKGSNNDGVWNEQGAAIKITILPPWWRTWWAYSFYGMFVVMGIFALDQLQRKRLLTREREQTREKELLQARKIEEAYHALKETQSQLIQSEKMASLGELTAGIAHEIQNPLNFVNNFSEVSIELLDEMKAELAIGNWQPAKDIADDVKQNLEKIVHHGKRADTIVKGMLQHSRSSSGVKEPTDINALADEYLRLAYHGLRAKDKSFNATMKTDFDGTIGNINVVPQDIGRVILNLITNAFYAVAERKKQDAPHYEPIVSLITKKIGEKILISVKDNGDGIPQHVLSKIFQPFFTTKPTGQGTGLGLSLSYDIVKAHGGELRVESKEGFGAEFTIILPH